jgi:excinuclease ABC subunit A
VYILDEPTTGLHFADVEKLLGVLHRLTDAGNTVIVIEHNLDVLKTADHIIDLGPDGGDRGGEVLVEGTPEEIAASKRSATGEYLRPLLGQHPIPSSALAHAPRNGRKSSNGSGNGRPAAAPARTRRGTRTAATV